MCARSGQRLDEKEQMITKLFALQQTVYDCSMHSDRRQKINRAVDINQGQQIMLSSPHAL